MSNLNNASVGGYPGITTQSVVTGTRAVGSVYQNLTGKPILVVVSFAHGSGQNITANCDAAAAPSTVVAFNGNGGSNLDTVYTTISFWVLPNYYYGFTGAGSMTRWIEYV